MLCGRKMAPENLGSVLVLGLGKSGKAVARYCADLLGTRVERVFIAAGARNADSEAFVQSLAGEGIDCAFGDDALDGLDGHFDLCIPSPGIPYWEKLYVAGKALSCELISEVEFAWRESAAASIWVAITGTNGKTTTTACAAHLLEQAGFAAAAVGNIGDVCLDAVAAGTTDVYVAEVSSYQLASTVKFAPDVAVILNVTPDHIHWHRTLEAYAEAKFKVLENLGLADGATTRPVAILNAVDDVVRAKVREVKAIPDEERAFGYIPVGTAEGIRGDMRVRCGAANAAFVDEGGMLHVAYRGIDHEILTASSLLIKGEHNVSNALHAASVAVALGAPDDAIARGLMTFAALPHRIEPAGTVQGVACYNDSKATNVDATLVALEAFPGMGLTVLLGGDDKGTDLSDLVACAARTARCVVCFGEGGPRFREAFEAARDTLPAGFSVLAANHLEDALDVALGQSVPGEVVLLSPACASFDEFKSFEQRGDVFKQLVKDRAERLGA